MNWQKRKSNGLREIPYDQCDNGEDYEFDPLFCYDDIPDYAEREPERDEAKWRHADERIDRMRGN